MQTKIMLFILFCCCCFDLSGQKPGKRDTSIVRSKAVPFYFPIYNGKNEIDTTNKDHSKNTTDKSKSDIPVDQEEGFSGEPGSADGILKRNSTVENGNLKVTFSYLVNYEGHDFALGDYIVDKSFGLKNMLLFMKKNVEGDFADYLEPPRKVTINITGGADATPINGPILYKSEFGAAVSENCRFEGRMENMKVITNQVITDNSTLAFLRSVAAKDYIMDHIFTNKNLQPDYFLSATVSPEKGGQYRRVSIEMIIHDAIK